MGRIIHGTSIVAGEVSGEALVSHEPLSFWGGYDQLTGEIIDRRHPLSGQIAAGRVFAVPSARGSSTTTSVLLESVRAGKAPAAIITNSVDRFFALASIVADEMYGKPIPLIALSEEDFLSLQSGQWIQIQPDGTLIVDEPAQF
jgi:predicted aconitase with swiveling domain